MSPKYATARTVDRDELLDFLRPRHRGLLATTRRDGRPQLSPVTCGVDADGRIVVVDVPRPRQGANAKADAARVDLRAVPTTGAASTCRSTGAPRCSTCPTRSTDWSSTSAASPVSTPTGTSTAPRCSCQDKSLLRITIERWGPIATGGFPPDVAARLERRRGHQLDLEAVAGPRGRRRRRRPRSGAAPSVGIGAHP